MQYSSTFQEFHKVTFTQLSFCYTGGLSIYSGYELLKLKCHIFIKELMQIKLWHYQVLKKPTAHCITTYKG